MPRSLRQPPLRRLVGTATVAALAFALAACTSDNPTGGSTTASTSGASGGPVEGHTLSIPVQGVAGAFDLAKLDDGQAAYVWSAIYDNLVYRENMTGVIKPQAAESWQYAPDGKTLTIKLRSGMKFSNGDPVTAADVAATMKYFKDTPGLQQSKFAKVTSVNAADDLTVKISFEQYVPEFLPNLANASGVIADAKVLANPDQATNPVGSGAYVLDTKATVAGTTYVLDRRKDYWDVNNRPFQTFTVRVIPDSQAILNALQAGEINASGVRADQKAALKGSGGNYAFYPFQGQAVAALDVFDRTGTKVPALGDVRVRQALNYALDREGLVKGVLQGAGVATDQIVSSRSPVYEASLNATYPYDPGKARELLKDAGYASGLTLELPSTYITTSFEPIVTQQLADVGIKVTWTPVPPAETTSVMQSGKYAIAFVFIGLGAYQNDMQTFFGQGGPSNPANYTNADLDTMWGKIHQTPDIDAQLPLYKDLNRYVVQQGLVAPLFQIGGEWATRDGVAYLDDGSSGVQTVRLFGLA